MYTVHLGNIFIKSVIFNTHAQIAARMVKKNTVKSCFNNKPTYNI